MLATVVSEVGLGSEISFKRGDANADEELNIADAVFILSYLFADGDEPLCMDSADSNDDGQVNIADAVMLLSYLFGDEESLPEPFSECGVDETPDGLDCEVTNCGE